LVIRHLTPNPSIQDLTPNPSIQDLTPGVYNRILATLKAQRFVAAADQLVWAGRRFDRRGWVLGTSGNFSVVVDREPLRLAITPSGTFKGELRGDEILEIDARGAVLDGRDGKPSAEALLHVEIVGARGAGAVLHTHSAWSTLLSDAYCAQGGLTIEGYEMLKGLDGIRTHEHREWLPIVDNDQDIPRLAANVRTLLDRHPAMHGFLIRRHGLYTWGADLPQAVRHVEILEFLLEMVGRQGKAERKRDAFSP
jgi:methylthioribulose-1-phosphate dehydratase